MKIYSYPNKVIHDPTALKKLLEANNFSVVAVGMTGNPSTAVVYLSNTETKDPSALVDSYVDPDILTVTAPKQTPADGRSKCVLTIQKTDYEGRPKPGSDVVNIVPSELFPVCPSTLTLSNGVGSAELGPTTLVGELSVEVRDAAGVLKPAIIVVRFM